MISEMKPGEAASVPLMPPQLSSWTLLLTERLLISVICTPKSILEESKKSKLPAILDPRLEHSEAHEGRLIVTEVAGVFHRAGVRFALSTASGTLGRSEPWFQAATAVRQGVPRDVALKALTATAAEILGVADRVGTIAKGKDATLVVLTGDPLNVNTWVDRLLIEGRTAYERSKDARLAELLKTGER